MPKAIFIDASGRTVKQVTYANSYDVRKLVGGWIELAVSMPNGDHLYVDEEGLLKDNKNFFTIRGGHQPFAGNGLIVGPEVNESEPFNNDVQHTAAEVQKMVSFGTVRKEN